MDNVTINVKKWNEHLSQHLIANDVILMMYLIFGSAGNAIVIFVYAFKMRSELDDRYFIPLLAVSDLAACLTGNVMGLLINLYPVRYPSGDLCRTLWGTSRFSSLTSTWLTLSIAIQRYMKVCHLGKQFKLKWRRTTVIVIIVLSLTRVSLEVGYHGLMPVYNKPLNITGHRCGAADDFIYGVSVLDVFHILRLSTGIFVILSLMILYSLITRTIYLQSKFNRKSSLMHRIWNSLKRKSAEDNRQQVNIQICVPHNESNEIEDKTIETSNKANSYAQKRKSSCEIKPDLVSEKEIEADVSQVLQEAAEWKNGNCYVQPSLSNNRIGVNKSDQELNSEFKKQNFPEKITTDIIKESNNSLSERARNWKQIIFRKLKIPNTNDTDSVISSADLSSGSKSPQNQRVSMETTNRLGQRKKNTMEKLSRRYTYTFMAVTSFYILTYIPTITLVYLQGADTTRFWVKEDVAEHSGVLFVRRLTLLNHVVNPLIYAVFDKRFRSEFLKLKSSRCR